MKRTIDIGRYDWSVSVWVLDGESEIRPILARLRALGIKDKDFIVVKDLMRSTGLNWGFTFSSYQQRSSVMVIGPAETRGEYFNTIVHESYHLAKHIAQCDGLNPYSEDVAYISGDFVQDVYGRFAKVICLCND